jgi:glycosyltransferase involved in cell wall biosynthesis
VVADNDGGRSAEAVIGKVQADGGPVIVYCVEPRQNIALARNLALRQAHGDFVAFIDDDEFPVDDWLFHLFQAQRSYNASGVLGPVKPFFETTPPRWATEGRFFDRPNHPSGHRLSWSETRTGNVLFDRSILSVLEVPFRSEFATGGEDVDFFRRVMAHGHAFVWCEEAVAYESVPPSRCNRKYLLRRALLRGSTYKEQRTNRLAMAVKSLVAVPCYSIALPVLALFGQPVFLRYLIKLLDHGSRLLAYLGFSVMTRREI